MRKPGDGGLGLIILPLTMFWAVDRYFLKDATPERKQAQQAGSPAHPGSWGHALRSEEVRGSTLTRCLLLGSFPLSLCLEPPCRKWKPHGGSLQRGPQAGLLCASGTPLGPWVPVRERAALRESGSNGTSQWGGGQGKQGTPSLRRADFWRWSLLFSSSSSQTPVQPFLQRILGAVGGWCFIFCVFLIPTYTMTQCVTCHTCLNGIILCALFWFGI